MKQLLAFFSLFAILSVHGQENETDFVFRQATTKKGSPAGTLTENRIDKNGGTLGSDDGKLELIVPAGAVNKKTRFSIQPVTNEAPNGSGKAYQLEPSGTKFSKPLRLVFRFDSKEYKNEMQSLMGIAMQDGKGRWFRLTKFILDTVAKTISADINHFSSYGRFDAVKLEPQSARVKVSKQVKLSVRYIETEDFPISEDGDMLAPLTPSKNISEETSQAAIWAVNGIVNGNAEVGQLTTSTEVFSDYKAPARVPAQNPVAVTVQLKNHSFEYNGKSFNDLKLVSNILVYDNMYEVKMVASMRGGNAGAWGGVVTYNDVGSFLVSLDKHEPEVLWIENNLETLTDNCQKNILNPATCTGIIHITGVRTVKITPAAPPALPDALVEITFIQKQAEFSQIIYTCPPPPGTSGYGKAFNGGIAMLRMPGFPVSIKFSAKEEAQTVYKMGKEGDPLYVRFIVKQVRE